MNKDNLAQDLSELFNPRHNLSRMFDALCALYQTEMDSRHPKVIVQGRYYKDLPLNLHSPRDIYIEPKSMVAITPEHGPFLTHIPFSDFSVMDVSNQPLSLYGSFSGGSLPRDFRDGPLVSATLAMRPLIDVLENSFGQNRSTIFSNWLKNTTQLVIEDEATYDSIVSMMDIVDVNKEGQLYTTAKVIKALYEESVFGFCGQDDSYGFGALAIQFHSVNKHKNCYYGTLVGSNYDPCSLHVSSKTFALDMRNGVKIEIFDVV